MAIAWLIEAFALGPGFGLTQASDQVIVKFVVEYEFTPETVLR